MKKKYNVKIGSADAKIWGTVIEANSTQQLKSEVLHQIENLSPLNSTKEMREEYRNRFRHQPIFAAEIYSNEFVEI